MPLISVIVPVYKVEPYLRECVDSILNQTFTDFELILVDDGSPDYCPILCDTFAKKDNRVLVIHKENGGLSSARNAGLAISKGEFISFIDSDDYISPIFLERLFNKAVETNADIVACNFCCVRDESKMIDKLSGEERLTFKVYKRKEISKIPFDRHRISFVVAWNKLYRKDLFENIKFKDKMLHEDEWIVHHLFGEANTITTIEDEMYFYRIRNNSIVARKSELRSFKSSSNAFEAFFDRYLFATNKRWHPAALNSGKACLYLLRFIILNYDTEESAKFVEKHYKETMKIKFLNIGFVQNKYLLKRAYLEKRKIK